MGGFRADLIYLFSSSFLLTFPLLYFFERARDSRRAKVNATFCIFGLVAFAAYLYRLKLMLFG
ncbi:hypothetical protein GRAN_4455 [Granulicella sibirica]|uniref:Uncharacterized protein n=1 Tax=Granulicella sibirica TaxID=2479048 RepID=A0A4Q0T1D8_9BACT|nr:hypothetical protein GRAN_4455 [Granulicella sibirica]